MTPDSQFVAKAGGRIELLVFFPNFMVADESSVERAHR
jgi:hypothetical protein